MAGGGGIPCGGSPVCLLKKAAKTGSSEGFQARAQSAHGRKIIKISSGVGAVPCFCRLFELAGQASGTRNPTPVRLPPLSPGTKQGRGCVPPRNPLPRQIQFLPYSSLILYPTPISVKIYFGSAGFSSSFLRICAMFTRSIWLSLSANGPHILEMMVS